MARDISHLGSDLNHRIDKIGTAIERGQRDMLRAGAQAAKAEHLDTIRGDAGGDLRLSRVRSGRGAAIGARYDIGGVFAEVKATGPIQLLANPTRPHRIPRAGRRRLLAIPGVGVRSSANHPGTRGKDTWNKGRQRAEPKVRTAISRKSDEVVRRAFTSGG